MKRLTRVDYTILGSLSEARKSGYGIQKEFEQSALFSYSSSSPGTIYPAIKRLIKLELIGTWIPPRFDKKSGQELNISSKGLARLNEWLVQPVHINDVRSNMPELILRYALMDKLVNDEKKIEFLQSLLTELEGYMEILKQEHKMCHDLLSVTKRQAMESIIIIFQGYIDWTKKTLRSFA